MKEGPYHPPGFIYDWICPICEIEVNGTTAEIALHVIDAHHEEYLSGDLEGRIPVRSGWVLDEWLTEIGMYKV